MPRKTTRLKRLIEAPEILVMPGVYDALSAKLAERAGFAAALMSGYSVSAAMLGEPDVGYLTMTEMVHALKRICDATSIPVMADGDTGYGNAMNVRRVVREYESAGAAGVFFEDQEWPKRCGHMEGKRVIPPEEHAMKIRAAVEARRDKDFVIMARTDARAVNGLEDALARAKAYAAAGADALFVEAPQSVAEMREIAAALDKPLMANMVERGKTPLVPLAELQAMGYGFVTYPVAAVYTVAAALTRLWTELKAAGTTEGVRGGMVSFPEFNAIIGLPAYREADLRYKADPCGKAAPGRK
jgi:methylisocitrate lyase